MSTYDKDAETEDAAEDDFALPGEAAADEHGKADAEHGDVAGKIEDGVCDEMVRRRVTLAWKRRYQCLYLPCWRIRNIRFGVGTAQ